MTRVELTVDQAKLHALQRRLKEAGDRGLTRELNVGLRRAAEPIAADERAAALALPARGPTHTGLRQGIADSVRVTVTRSDRNPGVRVSSRSRLARASMARSWRHPVFGNRRIWVTQTLSPGWWSRTAMRRREEVRRQVRQVVENVARKITR